MPGGLLQANDRGRVVRMFKVQVRRARIESLTFEVEAHNSQEAHKLAEKEVRDDKHTTDVLEDRVTVIACH